MQSLIVININTASTFPECTVRQKKYPKFKLHNLGIFHTWETFTVGNLLLSPSFVWELSLGQLSQCPIPGCIETKKVGKHRIRQIRIILIRDECDFFAKTLLFGTIDIVIVEIQVFIFPTNPWIFPPRFYYPLISMF